MQEIKPYTWIRCKIERYNLRPSNYLHPYLEIYFKLEETNQEGVKRQTSLPRLSIPNNVNTENSARNKLFRKLIIKNNEELTGKEVYLKFRLKPNPRDKNNFFKIVDLENIKTIEEYNLEREILRLLTLDLQVSPVLQNRLIQKISKNKIKSPIKKNYVCTSKQLITPPVCVVKSTICEIDLESFYPNIVLANQFIPENDLDKIYLKIIKKLLQIKQERHVLNESIEDFAKLKILMNSLIGNLKNKDFIFYSPELYDRIIGEGNRILQRVLNYIKRTKEGYEQRLEKGNFLEILRVHTDGIHLRIKVTKCKNDLLSKINKFLSESESDCYKFNYKGYWQRGIFKNKNNFALWKTGEPLIIKGTFFKKNKKLTEVFLKEFYSEDLPEYNKLKKELLLKNTKEQKELINFLDSRYEINNYGKINTKSENNLKI